MNSSHEIYSLILLCKLQTKMVIYEGELESLRRFKDDANEVKNGLECGIGVKNYKDVRPGDKIEVFEVKEIARSL